ncbi:BTB/POZ domain-containing protein 9-like isoform X2 [Zophobas morio]|uniref:BTB/POZ domain-containing protein 9-like isoform X2 n=1 Tax=Zophobas morio TaxID=2755281 RepID=UPI003083457D
MANEEQPRKKIMSFIDPFKMYKNTAFFLKNRLFSDVKLILGDTIIPAHKIVLAIESKYFESIFIEDPNQAEIIIEDVPLNAFESILRYIYTGSVVLRMSYGDHLFDALQLARKHGITSYENIVHKRIASIISLTDVCRFLNKADELQMDELKEICFFFIESNVSTILRTYLLNELTQKAMVQLLKRHSFPANETEIFTLVKRWCTTNVDVDSLVTGCVQLTKLTRMEIFTLVWPSKVIDSERLLDALVKIRNNSSETAQLINKNTTPNDKVIYDWNNGNGVTLDVRMNRFFNHVKLKILGKSECSYYLATSFNRDKWDRVIDYTQYACRHEQNLYFNEIQEARYIRVVFSKRTQLGQFQVFFDHEVPGVCNQIVRPSSNVINSETKIFLWSEPGDKFTVGLALDQPYMFSYMEVLLRFYKHVERIETSVDYENWQIVENRDKSLTTETPEKNSSRLTFRFINRIVSYVKVVGDISSDKISTDFKAFLADFRCFDKYY